MSKHNTNMRFRKMVNGYKSIHKIKGDNDVYSVLTDTKQENGQVLDSTKTVVAEVSATNVHELEKRLMEGFVSLGANFPNTIIKNVEFDPITNNIVVTLNFSPAPHTGSGYFRISNGTGNTSRIYSNTTAGAIAGYVTSIPGCEDCVVTAFYQDVAIDQSSADYDRLVLTFPFVDNFAPIQTLGSVSNLTGELTVFFDQPLASCYGSYTIDLLDGPTTVPILPGDTIEQINTKLQVIDAGLTAEFNIDGNLVIDASVFNLSVYAQPNPTSLAIRSSLLIDVEGTPTDVGASMIATTVPIVITITQ